jgi:methyltransferase
VWLERPFVAVLGYPMLALVVGAQALRYWAIATLGRRWNVRVIVVPDEPAVVRGPYAYIRHPNYLAVIIEGVAIPLVHTAWITAIAFTVLNAWILAIRIRCEERALSHGSDYERRFARRPRFVPAASGAEEP